MYTTYIHIYIYTRARSNRNYSTKVRQIGLSHLFDPTLILPMRTNIRIITIYSVRLITFISLLQHLFSLIKNIPQSPSFLISSSYSLARARIFFYAISLLPQQLSPDNNNSWFSPKAINGANFSAPSSTPFLLLPLPPDKWTTNLGDTGSRTRHPTQT